MLFWGQGSDRKNKAPLQWLIICCRVNFLSLSSFTHESAEIKNTVEKFIINAEAYLEPCQMSTMELFGVTVFAKKLHHRFSVDIWKISGSKVACSKIPKYLRK